MTGRRPVGFALFYAPQTADNQHCCLSRGIQEVMTPSCKNQIYAISYPHEINERQAPTYLLPIPFDGRHFHAMLFALEHMVDDGDRHPPVQRRVDRHVAPNIFTCCSAAYLASPQNRSGKL